MFISFFCYFVAGFFVAYYLLRRLVPLLVCCSVDLPNNRSSHSVPTPRGGGISFVFVSSFAAIVFLLLPGSELSQVQFIAAPLVSLPLACVGFLDDRHNLPASWRYGVQLATALIIVILSPLATNSVGVLPLISLFFFIAITAVINFTNFMDGLDGLVAGCMVLTITSAAIQLAAPSPIWSLVGALLGFLLWNWSPAKVFMGDVGSTFLGAVFSLLVLQSSTWSEALALLLVATPLMGDAFLCVLRRLMDGQRVFQPHRLHLFQRLHQAGWPHARVSSFYIAATAVLAIALLCGGLPWVIILAALELLLGIWLDQRVAVPFVVASRS
ncbi:MraY family glycosyltransferase [Parasynechococcus marenigrum]|uniref:Glycosyltransferase family 4 protein n=1 Tax=Parasynechococcus marenigrum (strain WH8102) TaxID=84588 RepID=Q7U8Z9_PARMW|nr:glycosyltransferase family 4 protein [Parasynechococcus marenigrum]CAE06975.1 Putative glycosyltransferase family 4 protein [Parasynechococcus marenigrum WH 8102]